MIKVLLFDADGVLLFHSDKLFSQRLAEYLGIPLERIQPFFEKVFDNCIVGSKDLKNELALYAPTWDWKGSIDELLNFWFEYEHNADKPLIEYLRKARQNGIRSYVATNSERYRAERIFKHLNLDGEVLEKIYAAGILKVAKPDATFFQYIFDDLSDIAKDEILFWDDTPGHVEAARQFRFHAETYTDFAVFKTKMANYV